jgi:transcriptional regulator with XRE-family HTH domain
MLKAVSGNLKRLKQEKRVNSATIARALNVSHSTVSDWEHGKKIPRAGHIQKLADFFGVSKSEILVSYEEQKRAVEITPEEEKIFSQLSDESKQALFEYASFLLSKQEQDKN